MKDDRFGRDLAVVGHLRDHPKGRAWLRGLPELVETVSRGWDLQVGEPWPDGRAAWTAPAVTRDGHDVVLKLSWPHEEAAGEAAALYHWRGHGAVEVVRHDPQRWALLLARCRPGLALRAHDAAVDGRLEIAADVLRRLWAVPVPERTLGPVPDLASVTTRWAELADRRLAGVDVDHDPGVVRTGVDLLRSLPAGATAVVLLHGDFNPGNVLLDSGRGWLAIDPKPMLGDPAYDPWPLVTQLGHPFTTADPVGVLRRRFRRFGDLVGAPADRLAAWSLARTVESGLWEHAHGRAGAAAAEFARAAVVARV
ncbi:aminoglycoside phosphotransferase family protein [Egicoccus sp. AB-alg6-2]|uniref:aminoglycoside phosphotransferase family protein n=1 Tax=Egicoccus sp. AB-alg6-2 TaxID=3242692 RepID=UPI00359E2872